MPANVILDSEVNVIRLLPFNVIRHRSWNRKRRARKWQSKEKRGDWTCRSMSGGAMISGTAHEACMHVVRRVVILAINADDDGLDTPDQRIITYRRPRCLRMLHCLVKKTVCRQV